MLAVSACQQAGDDGTPAEKTPQPNPAASAAPSTAAPDTMTCTDPVRPDDTAASLIERYKEEARVETLYGVEGDELPGVVLWPNDSARRVEVIFAEEAREQVAGVLVSGAMKRRAAGLAVGDPIARAAEVNGKPFALWGFGWDYGGYVSDLKGGKLQALPGGCGMMLRLGPREDAVLPNALLGEVQLSSDDPRIEAADVQIEEIALSYQRPKNEKGRSG